MRFGIDARRTLRPVPKYFTKKTVSFIMVARGSHGMSEKFGSNTPPSLKVFLETGREAGLKHFSTDPSHRTPTRAQIVVSLKIILYC